MTYFACGRNKQNTGDKLVKILIPFDDEDDDVRQTDLAYGIPVNGQFVWLAKSQLQDVENSARRFICWIPFWLVKNKSLELFVDSSHEPSLFGDDYA